jgi:hypothetical protein
MQFLNTANHPVQLIVMDIAVKRDTFTPMTYLQPPGCPFSNLQWSGTPESAFRDGYLHIQNYNSYGLGVGVVGTIPGKGSPPAPASNNNFQFTHRDYGAHPMQVPLFRDYYKIIRSTNVRLDINETHFHTVSLSPNMMMDNLAMRQMLVSGSSQKINALPGLSVYTMCILRGYIAPAASGVTTTTSGGAVNVLQTLSCSGSIIHQVPFTLQKGNPFPYAVDTAHINAMTGMPVQDIIHGPDWEPERPPPGEDQERYEELPPDHILNPPPDPAPEDVNELAPEPPQRIELDELPAS